MFAFSKFAVVVGVAGSLAACGNPGGQEPAREPAPGVEPTSSAPVAWTGQAPGDGRFDPPAPLAEPTPSPVAPTPRPVDPAPTPRPVDPAPTPRPVDPAPAPVAKPAPSGLPAQYREILDAHNQYRARHCAQPLRWSQKLEAVAQDWADQLAGANCAFEHRQRNRFGENLTFFAPVGSQSPAGVATGWYSEVEQYDFSKGKFDFQTGHFTQLVWTSTTELGCGVSRCNGGEIWVCNYNPPGNMMGDFARRVLHPSQCVSSER